MCNDLYYGLAERLFRDEYTRHDPNTSMDQNGPQPFIENLAKIHEAFPDQEIQIGEIIAEDDQVAFQGTWTGTHEGEFRGIEPTNTSFEISGNAVHRVRDGEITETWAIWDVLGILEQIGAVEQPTP